MSSCQHEWSEHYVCSLCGSIKYGSAPLWVLCTKMGSGPRGVWIAIWTVADRDTQSPDEVYPGNDLLGTRAGGVSVRSVQRQLEALALAGWIRVVERGSRRYIRLAWAEPRADWAAMAKAEAVERARDRIVAGHDDIVAPDGGCDTTTILSQATTISSPGTTGTSSTHDDIVTHTLGNLGPTLEVDLGRAGEPAPESTGTPPLAEPSPRKRRRKPPEPKPGQGTLDIPGGAGGPEANAVAELLEAHRLARGAAGIIGAWPAKNKRAMQSMRDGCKAAIKRHGVEWCRAMLAWRGAIWARDPSQWAYSTSSVWTQPSIDHAKRAMGGGPARASPRPRRGWAEPEFTERDGDRT